MMSAKFKFGQIVTLLVMFVVFSCLGLIGCGDPRKGLTISWESQSGATIETDTEGRDKIALVLEYDENGELTDKSKASVIAKVEKGDKNLSRSVLIKSSDESKVSATVSYDKESQTNLCEIVATGVTSGEYSTYIEVVSAEDSSVRKLLYVSVTEKAKSMDFVDDINYEIKGGKYEILNLGIFESVDFNLNASRLFKFGSITASIPNIKFVLNNSYRADDMSVIKIVKSGSSYYLYCNDRLVDRITFVDNEYFEFRTYNADDENNEEFKKKIRLKFYENLNYDNYIIEKTDKTKENSDVTIEEIVEYTEVLPTPNSEEKYYTYYAKVLRDGEETYELINSSNFRTLDITIGSTPAYKVLSRHLEANLVKNHAQKMNVLAVELSPYDSEKLEYDYEIVEPDSSYVLSGQRLETKEEYFRSDYYLKTVVGSKNVYTLITKQNFNSLGIVIGSTPIYELKKTIDCEQVILAGNNNDIISNVFSVRGFKENLNGVEIIFKARYKGFLDAPEITMLPTITKSILFKIRDYPTTILIDDTYTTFERTEDAVSGDEIYNGYYFCVDGNTSSPVLITRENCDGEKITIGTTEFSLSDSPLYVPVVDEINVFDVMNGIKRGTVKIEALGGSLGFDNITISSSYDSVGGLSPEEILLLKALRVVAEKTYYINGNKIYDDLSYANEVSTILSTGVFSIDETSYYLDTQTGIIYDSALRLNRITTVGNFGEFKLATEPYMFYEEAEDESLTMITHTLKNNQYISFLANTDKALDGEFEIILKAENFVTGEEVSRRILLRFNSGITEIGAMAGEREIEENSSQILSIKQNYGIVQKTTQKINLSASPEGKATYTNRKGELKTYLSVTSSRPTIATVYYLDGEDIFENQINPEDLSFIIEAKAEGRTRITIKAESGKSFSFEVYVKSTVELITLTSDPIQTPLRTYMDYRYLDVTESNFGSFYVLNEFGQYVLATEFKENANYYVRLEDDSYEQITNRQTLSEIKIEENQTCGLNYNIYPATASVSDVKIYYLTKSGFEYFGLNYESFKVLLNKIATGGYDSLEESEKAYFVNRLPNESYNIVVSHTISNNQRRIMVLTGSLNGGGSAEAYPCVAFKFSNESGEDAYYFSSFKVLLYSAITSFRAEKQSIELYTSSNTAYAEYSIATLKVDISPNNTTAKIEDVRWLFVDEYGQPLTVSQTTRDGNKVLTFDNKIEMVGIGGTGEDASKLLGSSISVKALSILQANSSETHYIKAYIKDVNGSLYDIIFIVQIKPVVQITSLTVYNYDEEEGFYYKVSDGLTAINNNSDKERLAQLDSDVTGNSRYNYLDIVMGTNDNSTPTNMNLEYILFDATVNEGGVWRPTERVGSYASSSAWLGYDEVLKKYFVTPIGPGYSILYVIPQDQLIKPVEEITTATDIMLVCNSINNIDIIKTFKITVADGYKTYLKLYNAQDVADLAQSEALDKNYYLMNDIDMTGKNIPQIGSQTVPFSGTIQTQTTYDNGFVFEISGTTYYIFDNKVYPNEERTTEISTLEIYPYNGVEYHRIAGTNYYLKSYGYGRLYHLSDMDMVMTNIDIVDHVFANSAKHQIHTIYGMGLNKTLAFDGTQSDLAYGLFGGFAGNINYVNFRFSYVHYNYSGDFDDEENVYLGAFAGKTFAELEYKKAYNSKEGYYGKYFNSTLITEANFNSLGITINETEVYLKPSIKNSTIFVEEFLINQTQSAQNLNVYAGTIGQNNMKELDVSLTIYASLNILKNNQLFFGGMCGENTAQWDANDNSVFVSIQTQITNANPNSVVIGGVVGVSSGVIKKVQVSGTIVGGQKVAYLGGVAGLSNADILDCFSSVVLKDALYLGGIVGLINNNNIENCFYTNYCANGSALSSTVQDNYVGGLAGGVNQGSIQSSYVMLFNSDVNNQIYSSNIAGGLAGIMSNGCQISKSFFSGNVYAIAMAAGLVGKLNDSLTVTNAYVIGQLRVDSDVTCWLLVNNGSPSISTSYSAIVGYKLASVEETLVPFDLTSSGASLTNVYYLAGTSAQAGANSLTSTEMKQKAKFVNFDFDSTHIWSIIEGKNLGYPHLTDLYPTIPEQFTVTVNPVSGVYGVASDEENVTKIIINLSEFNPGSLQSVKISSLFEIVENPDNLTNQVVIVENDAQEELKAEQISALKSIQIVVQNQNSAVLSVSNLNLYDLTISINGVGLGVLTVSSRLNPEAKFVLQICVVNGFDDYKLSTVQEGDLSNDNNSFNLEKDEVENWTVAYLPQGTDAQTISGGIMFRVQEGQINNGVVSDVCAITFGDDEFSQTVVSGVIKTRQQILEEIINENTFEDKKLILKNYYQNSNIELDGTVYKLYVNGRNYADIYADKTYVYMYVDNFKNFAVRPIKLVNDFTVEVYAYVLGSFKVGDKIQQNVYMLDLEKFAKTFTVSINSGIKELTTNGSSSFEYISSLGVSDRAQIDIDIVSDSATDIANGAQLTLYKVNTIMIKAANTMVYDQNGLNGAIYSNIEDYFGKYYFYENSLIEITHQNAVSYDNLIILNVGDQEEIDYSSNPNYICPPLVTDEISANHIRQTFNFSFVPSYYKQITEPQVFKLVITNSDRKKLTREVYFRFVPQKVLDVEMSHYSDAEFTENNETMVSSYLVNAGGIPTDTILAGQYGLLEVKLLPEYSNFDKIEISSVGDGNTNDVISFKQLARNIIDQNGTLQTKYYVYDSHITQYVNNALELEKVSNYNTGKVQIYKGSTKVYSNNDGTGSMSSHSNYGDYLGKYYYYNNSYILISSGNFNTTTGVLTVGEPSYDYDGTIWLQTLISQQNVISTKFTITIAIYYNGERVEYQKEIQVDSTLVLGWSFEGLVKNADALSPTAYVVSGTSNSNLKLNKKGEFSQITVSEEATRVSGTGSLTVKLADGSTDYYTIDASSASIGDVFEVQVVGFKRVTLNANSTYVRKIVRTIKIEVVDFILKNNALQISVSKNQDGSEATNVDTGYSFEKAYYFDENYTFKIVANLENIEIDAQSTSSLNSLNKFIASLNTDQYQMFSVRLYNNDGSYTTKMLYEVSKRDSKYYSFIKMGADEKPDAYKPLYDGASSYLKYVAGEGYYICPITQESETEIYINEMSYDYVNGELCLTKSPNIAYSAGENTEWSDNPNKIYSYKQSEQEDFVATIQTSAITLKFVQKTSIDNPIPIYDESEFINMREGSDYILMEDLELSNFEPITAAIASLDGNGKTITINSFNNENLLSENYTTYNLGLFGTVSNSTILKNITVCYNILDEVPLTKLTSANFGGIAAINEGIITNCEVRNALDSEDNASVVFNSDKEATTVFMFGGLCAQNKKNITNSRVNNFNLTASGIVAGFVAQNTGVVSACYTNFGVIKNTSTQNVSNVAVTAGFVAKNSGKILSSYVGVGYVETIMPESDEGTKQVISQTEQISSNVDVGGFVYENSGQIADSFSAISLSFENESLNAYSGGFVFTNNSGGTIDRCYTITRIQKSLRSHTPFVGPSKTSNTLNCADKLSINDCYYYNFDFEIEGVALTNELGIKSLSIEQFVNSNNREVSCFEAYSLSRYLDNLQEVSSVWAFVNVNNISMNASSLFNDKLNKQIMGPQLVYANLKISPERTWKGYEDNKYIYNEICDYKYANLIDANYQSDVRIIDSAEKFVIYLTKDKQEDGIINENYRLVADIDLSSVDMSAFNTETFVGNLDGNGFTIKNINILSTSNGSVGLFGKIGDDEAKVIASVHNVNLTVDYINATNALCVGALAGKVCNSVLSNISVEAKNTNTMIFGKNFVGGLVGKIEGISRVSGITASVSVSAGFSNNYTNKLIYNSDLFTLYRIEGGSDYLFDVDMLLNVNSENVLSYAGGIFGVADLTPITATSLIVYKNDYNESRIKNLKVVGDSKVIGATAGGVIGLLGARTFATNILKITDQNSYIKSARFSGGIVGENHGTLNYARLVYEQNIQDSIDSSRNVGAVNANENYNLFRNDSSSTELSKAVGGLVGFNLGLTIGKAKITTGNLTNSYNKVKVYDEKADIVGGLVGISVGGNYNSNYVTSSVGGFKSGYTGGAIGYIATFDDVKLASVIASPFEKIVGDAFNFIGETFIVDENGDLLIISNSVSDIEITDKAVNINNETNKGTITYTVVVNGKTYNIEVPVIIESNKYFIDNTSVISRVEISGSTTYYEDINKHRYSGIDEQPLLINNVIARNNWAYTDYNRLDSIDVNGHLGGFIGGVAQNAIIKSSHTYNTETYDANEMSSEYNFYVSKIYSTQPTLNSDPSGKQLYEIGYDQRAGQVYVELVWDNSRTQTFRMPNGLYYYLDNSGSNLSICLDGENQSTPLGTYAGQQNAFIIDKQLYYEANDKIYEAPIIPSTGLTRKEMYDYSYAQTGVSDRISRNWSVYNYGSLQSDGTIKITVYDKALMPIYDPTVSITKQPIYTVEDFLKMKDAPTLQYELMNDLDFGGAQVSLFSAQEPFVGSFDGNGHTISNICPISGIGDSVIQTGIFGYTNGAQIYNLNISGIVVGKSTPLTLDDNFGILASTAINTIFEKINITNNYNYEVTSTHYVGRMFSANSNSYYIDNNVVKSVADNSVVVNEIIGGEFTLGGTTYQVANIKNSYATFEINGTTYWFENVNLFEKENNSYNYYVNADVGDGANRSKVAYNNGNEISYINIEKAENEENFTFSINNQTYGIYKKDITVDENRAFDILDESYTINNAGTTVYKGTWPIASINSDGFFSLAGKVYHYETACVSIVTIVKKSEDNSVSLRLIGDTAQNIGGIVGNYFAGENDYITDVNVDCKLNITSQEGKSGEVNIGGVIGRTIGENYGTNIYNNVFNGSLTTTCYGNIGGFVGKTSSASYRKNNILGDINITIDNVGGQSYIGGFVGNADSISKTIDGRNYDITQNLFEGITILNTINVNLNSTNQTFYIGGFAGKFKGSAYNLVIAPNFYINSGTYNTTTYDDVSLIEQLKKQQITGFIAENVYSKSYYLSGVGMLFGIQNVEILSTFYNNSMFQNISPVVSDINKVSSDINNSLLSTFILDGETYTISENKIMLGSDEVCTIDNSAFTISDSEYSIRGDRVYNNTTNEFVNIAINNAMMRVYYDPNLSLLPAYDSIFAKTTGEFYNEDLYSELSAYDSEENESTENPKSLTSSLVKLSGYYIVNTPEMRNLSYSGSKLNPEKISSDLALKAISSREQVFTYYLQTADLADGTVSITIDESIKLNGFYNGNNYKIKFNAVQNSIFGTVVENDAEQNDDKKQISLFACGQKSIVSNLYVSGDVRINVKKSGEAGSPVLIGFVMGSLESGSIIYGTYASGTLRVEDNDTEQVVGGLVGGIFDGQIISSGCNVDLYVNGLKTTKVGGLAGIVGHKTQKIAKTYDNCSVDVGFDVSSTVTQLQADTKYVVGETLFDGEDTIIISTVTVNGVALESGAEFECTKALNSGLNTLSLDQELSVYNKDYSLYYNIRDSFYNSMIKISNNAAETYVGGLVGGAIEFDNFSASRPIYGECYVLNSYSVANFIDSNNDVLISSMGTMIVKNVFYSNKANTRIAGADTFDVGGSMGHEVLAQNSNYEWLYNSCWISSNNVAIQNSLLPIPCILSNLNVQDDVIVIKSEEELNYYLNPNLNNSQAGITYELNCDMDFSKLNPTTSFAGILDGKGHKIYNIDSYFIKTLSSGGEIKNVEFVNENIYYCFDLTSICDVQNSITISSNSFVLGKTTYYILSNKIYTIPGDEGSVVANILNNKFTINGTNYYVSGNNIYKIVATISGSSFTLKDLNYDVVEDSGTYTIKYHNTNVQVGFIDNNELTIRPNIIQTNSGTIQNVYVHYGSSKAVLGGGSITNSIIGEYYCANANDNLALRTINYNTILSTSLDFVNVWTIGEIDVAHQTAKLCLQAFTKSTNTISTFDEPNKNIEQTVTYYIEDNKVYDSADKTNQVSTVENHRFTIDGIPHAVDDETTRVTITTYSVSTKEQYAEVLRYLNALNKLPNEVVIKLCADIDFDGITVNSINKGITLNGNNHIMSNFTVVNNAMFADSSNIFNVTFSNVNFYGKSGNGISNFSLLVYENVGTISDVTIENSVFNIKRDGSTDINNVSLIATNSSSTQDISNITINDVYINTDNAVNLGAVVAVNNANKSLTDISINGLTINSNATYLGGVVAVNNGTITNNGKTINNISITGSGTIGGITAVNSADKNIENVTISGLTIEGAGTIGGISGTNGGLIDSITLNNYNITSTASSDGYYVGGVVGANNKTLTNVSVSKTGSNKNIITAQNAVVGGIAGLNSNNGTVAGSGSLSVSDIDISSNGRVGGVVGTNNGSLGNASTQLTAQNIKIVSSGYIGGIAAVNAGSITNISLQTYDIETKWAGTGRETGGLIGANNTNATLSGFTLSGTNTLKSDKATVGGYIGKNNGTITLPNNFVVSGITISGKGTIGGFVGHNSAQILGTITIGGTSANSVSLSSLASSAEIGAVYGRTNQNVTFEIKNTTITDTEGAIVGNVVGTITNGSPTVSGTFGTGNSISSNGTFGGYVGKVVTGGILKVDMTQNITLTTTTKANNVGGLVGELCGTLNILTMKNITLTDSYASTNVGGFIGFNHEGTFAFSKAFGNDDEIQVTASGTTAQSVGGIVGLNAGEIGITLDGNNKFSVTSTNTNSKTGGIAGTNNGAIRRAILSNISVSGINYVGGVAGLNNGTIGNDDTANYAQLKGGITVSGNTYLGAITGLNALGANIIGSKEAGNSIITDNSGTYSVTYNSASNSADSGIGMLVAVNNGTMRNIILSFNDSQSFAVSNASTNVGLVVGLNTGTIENNDLGLTGFSNNKTVTISATDSATIQLTNVGLIGKNTGTIKVKNIVAPGLQITGYTNVGVIGYNGGTLNITNALISGVSSGNPITITADTTNGYAGVIGYNSGSVISSYLVIEYVNITGANVGAIAGYNNSTDFNGSGKFELFGTAYYIMGSGIYESITSSSSIKTISNDKFDLEYHISGNSVLDAKNHTAAAITTNETKTCYIDGENIYFDTAKTQMASKLSTNITLYVNDSKVYRDSGYNNQITTTQQNINLYYYNNAIYSDSAHTKKLCDVQSEGTEVDGVTYYPCSIFGTTYYYSTYGITTGQSNSPTSQIQVNIFVLFGDNYYFVNDAIYDSNYTQLTGNHIPVNSVNLFGNVYYAKNSKIYDSSYAQVTSNINLTLSKFTLHNVNYFVNNNYIYDELSNGVGSGSGFDITYEIEYVAGKASKVTTDDEEINVNLVMEVAISNVKLNDNALSTKFGVNEAVGLTWV